MSATAGEQGKLHSKVYRQKVIDEWTFSSPHGDEFNTKVTVHLVTGQDGFEFHAKSDHFDTMVESNIEELRLRVLGRCRIVDDARTGVVWEDWIEIKTSGSLTDAHHGYHATASFEIAWLIIKRAVLPSGRVVTICGNHVVTDFPKPKKAGEKDGERQGYINGRSIGHQYSYIRGTPEDVDALNDLLGRVTALHDRLNNLLEQNNVAINLHEGLLRLEVKQ